MSAIPHMVTITVFDREKYAGSDRPPGTLTGAVAWLQQKLEEIPEEGRASASFEIDSVSGYEDSHEPSIRISYERLETPGEAGERAAGEDVRRRARRALEILELRRLASKYPEEEVYPSA